MHKQKQRLAIGDRVRITSILAEHNDRTGIVVRIQSRLIDVEFDTPLRNGTKRAAFFPGELRHELEDTDSS